MGNALKEQVLEEAIEAYEKAVSIKLIMLVLTITWAFYQKQGKLMRQRGFKKAFY